MRTFVPPVRALIASLLALGWARAASVELGPQLEKIAAEAKAPGMAALVLRGDKVIASAVTGVRKAGAPEPITLQDRFHLGSNTKSMTATLVGMFVDEGKLKWSTTLGEVFGATVKDMHAGWKDVTLQQLLAHRSGLPANFSAPLLVKLRASSLGLPAQRQMVVTESLGKAPEYPPGSKHEYSNLGFLFAGAMLEKISGQSWEALMNERLFKPLGITSAGFGPPGTRGKLEQPWGHTEAGDPIQGDNPAAMGPAGTVHMAIGDWAKFVALHLRGDPRNPHHAAKLLECHTFAWLHTPHDAGNYVAGWVRETNPAARGHRTGDAGDAIWHNGSNRMWYAIMYLAPERDCAVLIAANRASPAVRQACDRAARAWLKEFAPGK